MTMLATFVEELPAEDQAVRAAIEHAGGLLNRRELATLWKVSATRIDQLTRAPDFPSPTITAKVPLWTVAVIGAWARENGRTPPPRQPGQDAKPDPS